MLTHTQLTTESSKNPLTVRVHLLRALRAPDVRPPLLHLNPDVGPQALAAEEVRAVEEEGEAVDRHGQQAQGTFPKLRRETLL